MAAGTQLIPDIAVRQTQRVKGTAPTSTPDLEEIVRLVKLALPHARWWQLTVSHSADDDGLWFFQMPGCGHHVQIESSRGLCPFIIETSHGEERHAGETPAGVAQRVVRWLQEQQSSH